MKVGQTGDLMWLGIGTLWITDLTEILWVRNTFPVPSLFIERFFSFFADKFSIIGDLNNVWEMLFIWLILIPTYIIARLPTFLLAVDINSFIWPLIMQLTTIFWCWVIIIIKINKNNVHNNYWQNTIIFILFCIYWCSVVDLHSCVQCLNRENIFLTIICTFN